MINYVQNKILLTSWGLTPYNIDLFHRYIYYRLLCSKYFYYANLLLLLKNRLLMKFGRGSIFTKRRVYTVLRSPFVHKKSREQFEYRFIKSNFFIYNVFNLRYNGTPFAGKWLHFGNFPFKNNQIKVKSFNWYTLLK